MTTIATKNAIARPLGFVGIFLTLAIGFVFILSILDGYFIHGTYGFIVLPILLVYLFILPNFFVLLINLASPNSIIIFVENDIIYFLHRNNEIVNLRNVQKISIPRKKIISFSTGSETKELSLNLVKENPQTVVDSIDRITNFVNSSN